MNGGLSFDVDTAQLKSVGAELDASGPQIYKAYTRALRRTATTLRTMAARGLRDELQLRVINLLRKRLKDRMRVNTAGNGAEATLWIGVSDMPASWFKGTPKQTASGATMLGQNFPGAFVAKSKYKGRLTVFKRTSDKRLHIEEQNLRVNDSAQEFVEDKVFSEVETIFWQHFRRDLAARVKFNIGGM